MYQAPTSPYEAAWQQWNYNGGASRGEPMPRIEDYPEMFEEDLGSSGHTGDEFDPSGRGTIYHPPGQRIEPIQPEMAAGESAKRDKYDRGRDLRKLPVDKYPSGIDPMQPDYATAAPSPMSPDAVYGAYAPQPAQPGMGSNVMGGAMGNAMGRPGMANALLGGALGSAIKKNPGLLKRAAGGLMGAMTLGQLNRRKGY